MKTKVVYVVVSNGEDTYFEQVYISLYSLKINSPSSKACIVLDRRTNEALSKCKLRIKEYVDNIIVIDVPEEYIGARCSRFLKTNLRNYITGPYLFVDTDTIIAEPLDDIDHLISEEVSIASVKDSHLDFHLMPTYKEILRRAKIIGWNGISHDKIHFNSGVMFVNDDGKAHLLYEKWHNNWLYEQQFGIYFDQLALAKTNQELNYVIKELPGCWNFQIYYGALQYLYKAKIIHYAGDLSEGRAYYFRNKCVFDEIKRIGDISDETKNYIRNPKEAFVGKNTIVGEDLWDYYWSPLQTEFKFHPIRYKILTIISTFLQNLTKKMKYKKLKKS